MNQWEHYSSRYAGWAPAALRADHARPHHRGRTQRQALTDAAALQNAPEVASVT